MTTASKLTLNALLASTLFPLAAIGDPPAPVDGEATDAPVTVIRGSQVQVQSGSQKAIHDRATPSSESVQAVIVMRPAPGTFLRETTRLAAEAEAREHRAAKAEARETNLRLSLALQAVEDAAHAVETQPRKTRYLIVTPIHHGGVVDPKTGMNYPAVEGGVVDPKSGRFIPNP
jgi:hypothetical protein